MERSLLRRKISGTGKESYSWNSNGTWRKDLGSNSNSKLNMI